MDRPTDNALDSQRRLLVEPVSDCLNEVSTCSRCNSRQESDDGGVLREEQRGMRRKGNGVERAGACVRACVRACVPASERVR